VTLNVGKCHVTHLYLTDEEPQGVVVVVVGVTNAGDMENYIF